MASYSELSQHLGVSRPRICQLAKLGMPVHSLAAAEQWRRTNTVSRAPTNGQRTRIEFPRRKPGRPRKAANLQLTGDSLTDILNASFRRCACLSELFEDAKNEGNDAALRPLIPLQSRAVLSFLKMKKAHDKEQARRSLLVEKHLVIKRCRRAIETMVEQIRTLPTECGPLCNPQEPLRAEKILERAVAEVIDAGRNALDDLRTYDEEGAGR